MEVEQINSIINSLQEISKQISTANSFDSYLTIISILINIVLVVVVFFQLKFSRDEMNTRLRPWIGITQFKRNQFNKIGFSYQNFGQTPPIRVRIKVKHARREITLEEAKVELDEKDEIGVIMPDQTKYYLIKDIDEEAIVNVQNEQGEYYLSVLIEYVFGKNKIGEYLSILYYSKNAGNFAIKRQMSK